MIERKETLSKLEEIGREGFCERTPLSFVETWKPVGENALVHITQDVFRDVEMFEGYAGHPEDTVFNVLAKDVATCGGKDVARFVIENPVSDVTVLKKRQDIVRWVAQQVRDEHEAILERLADSEADLFWLFDTNDEQLKDLYEIVYFKFFLLRKLNGHAGALTLSNLYTILGSPAIGILTPIAYFVIPYMILRLKMKLNIGFKDYVKYTFMALNATGFMGTGSRVVKVISMMFSALFYFQGIFNSVEVAKTTYKIARFLTNKAKIIADRIHDMVILLKEVWHEDMMDTFVNTPAMNLVAREEAMHATTPVGVDFALWRNFGESLAFLKAIDKEAIKSMMLRSYVVDGVVGMQKSMGCYVHWAEGDVPKVNMAGMWHPCIVGAVKNGISLEGTNLILTGPNAGGKSTFIKSMLINVLLGQSWGMSIASACEMTPFANIHTQIHVPDSKGHASLFEAEMYRCKDTLKLIDGGNSGLSLIVMDEIFNSTNPVEGISGAYAIAKKIAECKSALLVFTTHFVYLTKLAKNTRRFVNYRMNVDRCGETGEISFPYVLERGVSKQYVALELLKKNGFDEGIIADALDVKTRLTK